MGEGEQEILGIEANNENEASPERSDRFQSIAQKVLARWERIQFSNPDEARAIENELFDELIERIILVRLVDRNVNSPEKTMKDFSKCDINGGVDYLDLHNIDEEDIHQDTFLRVARAMDAIQEKH